MRGPCGVDLQPQLGPRRPEVAQPLRPAAAAMAALEWYSRGAAAVKRRGKSTSGPRWCPNPPQFGPRGSGEGCSVVAGGGDGEWRHCRLERRAGVAELAMVKDMVLGNAPRPLL